jgi:hypothetical protein
MSLGGISFPLLADFHPKGAVASSYGLYLEDAGITDRATVIIDADGVVRHASSVTPTDKSDIAELAALCEEVNEAHENTPKSFPDPPGLEDDTILFVRSNCMFSTNAVAALGNLHIGAIPVRNVSEDPAALADSDHRHRRLTRSSGFRRHLPRTGFFVSQNGALCVSHDSIDEPRSGTDLAIE